MHTKELYKIINITENICITNNKKINISRLSRITDNLNKIKYIININNHAIIYNKIFTLNIFFDRINEYITNNYLNIDYDKIDELIIFAIKNKSSVLICDENNILSLLIVGRFLCKYYKLTFTEVLIWLKYKLQINIESKIYKNIINQLFIEYLKFN
jgi:hypothetical protein